MMTKYAERTNATAAGRNEGTRSTGKPPVFRQVIGPFLLALFLLAGLQQAGAQTGGTPYYWRVIGGNGDLVKFHYERVSGFQGTVTAIRSWGDGTSLENSIGLVQKNDGSIWTMTYGDAGLERLIKAGIALREMDLPICGQPVPGLPVGMDLSFILHGSYWGWYPKDLYIGNGTTDRATIPMPIAPGLTNIVDANNRFFVKSDGTVWALGVGLIGNGEYTSVPYLTPIQVPGLDSVVSLARGYTDVGGMHVIKSDGSVWAWGWGWLGDAGGGSSFSPTRIEPLCGIGAWRILVREGLGYVLTTNGAVLGWGSGAIGDGTTAARPTPVPVRTPDGLPLTNFVDIAFGNDAVYALRADGTVWIGGWCAFRYGVSPSPYFQQVPYLDNIIAISDEMVLRRESVPIEVEVLLVYIPEGGTGTCRVRLGANPGGNVTVTATRASGDNDITVRGGASLGFSAVNWNDWQTVTLAAGEDADLANGVAEIAVGVTGYPADNKVTVFEVDNDSTNVSAVWAWGRNNYGQVVAGGSTRDRLSPVRVLNDALAVFAGTKHSGAMLNDGSVFCWGLNRFGALGDGTRVERETPVQAVGMSNVTAIAAGLVMHAFKSDKTAWQWGSFRPEISPLPRPFPTGTPAITDAIGIGDGSGGTVILSEPTAGGRRIKQLRNLYRGKRRLASRNAHRQVRW